MNPERVEAIATATAKPVIALHYCDRDREISFDKASDGQRAAALLFMLLEQPSRVPLSLTSPKAISTTESLRSLPRSCIVRKEKRQMVFASHNANLVVNGSAEIVGQLDVNDAGERQFCVYRSHR